MSLMHSFCVVAGMLLTVHGLTIDTSNEKTMKCGWGGKDIKGKLEPNSGITQYTFEYATVPQRWDPAVLIDPLSGQEDSEKCMQLVCKGCGWEEKVVDDKVPETRVDGSSRCLFMSMFSPYSSEENHELLPIVFHIHHGNLMYGFKTDVSEVQSIVKRGIMVANANFRLGPMGFFAHPELNTINVGQQDLILALQWLKSHACAVGGNPGMITITGSSSGASQALMLIASPAAKGLFHRAWINSLTQFGSPDFFSQSVDEVYKKETLPTMKAIGCGTLQCLRDMSDTRLLLELEAINSPLVQMTKKSLAMGPTRPVFAYDGYFVPNMLQAACSMSFAQHSNVPIVVGQAKDELDNLKHQFSLTDMINNLYTDRLGLTQVGKDSRMVKCMQNRALEAQGVQETVEDLMFNLGSYIAASRPHDQNTAPRWHFLVTAPSSATKRSWHTAAELLSWAADGVSNHPDLFKSTPQYHGTTKKFVIGNAQPELRRYAVENFAHFAKHGRPQDPSWKQTESHVGVHGLPSKLWDNSPLTSSLHYSQHHSNTTIRHLHSAICEPQKLKRPDFQSSFNEDLQVCMSEKDHVHDLSQVASPKVATAAEDIQRQLREFKQSDFDFGSELLKAWMTPKIGQ